MNLRRVFHATTLFVIFAKVSERERCKDVCHLAYINYASNTAKSRYYSNRIINLLSHLVICIVKHIYFCPLYKSTWSITWVIHMYETSDSSLIKIIEMEMSNATRYIMRTQRSRCEGKPLMLRKKSSDIINKLHQTVKPLLTILFDSKRLFPLTPRATINTFQESVLIFGLHSTSYLSEIDGFISLGIGLDSLK